MPSQIFKTTPSKSGLLKFISTYAIKKKDSYLFSKSSFKKAQMEKTVEPFCSSLLPNYHISKQFYLTRPMDYKNIITVLRQVCKYHKIPFHSAIKYNQSKYEIHYSIDFGSAQ